MENYMQETQPTVPSMMQESASFPGYTNQQVDMIKTQIAKGASDEELKMFMFTAKRIGLDPFARQIYLIPRWDAKAQREVRTPQISIDGFRSVAADTGMLGGIDDAVFYDESGQVDETSAHPFKASVTVYRISNGVRCPFTASARWEEYRQTGKDGQPTKFWKDMPYGQLAKCAESLALRKAFPKQLGGVYTTDEMAQATPTEPALIVAHASPVAENAAEPAVTAPTKKACDTCGKPYFGQYPSCSCHVAKAAA